MGDRFVLGGYDSVAFTRLFYQAKCWSIRKLHVQDKYD
jgi:hypothetical protein